MSSFRLLLPAALLLVAVTGCGSARLIHGTPDGGVVAIPSNSNYWPMKYRDEAEKLMAKRCPNGYVVVEEGEVVVGKKASTSEAIDRTGPGKDASRQTDVTTVSRVTTVRDETEYRITFHARDARPAGRPEPVLRQVSTLPPPPPPPPGLPPQPVPIAN
jgi:hypothetical protein